MPKELVGGKPDVLCDLTEQDGRDIAALMERHRCAPAFRVPKLFMRTPLADLRETERNENGDDLAWLENGEVSHCLCNGDVLDTDKLRLQVGFAVFEQHGDDFLEVAVKLVEGFALRVGAWETWNKTHKKFGLRATFNDGRVSSHE